MPVSNGTLRLQYEQYPAPGMSLGRHLELDSRSLAYLVQRDPDLAKAQIRPQSWDCPLPILNQADLGSCVGNAGTAGLAALYKQHGVDLGVASLNGHTLSKTDAVADEAFAVELYHLSTVNDGFPGVYPPDDTGSSGLGACRSLKGERQITRYTWATGLRSMALAFQRGGVIVGMPWLNAFFHPDANGFIDADLRWPESGVAGGHEIYFEALEAYDEISPNKTVFRFRQSWGSGWGDHGYGRMRGLTYIALKQQIDVKQFVL